MRNGLCQLNIWTNSLYNKILFILMKPQNINSYWKRQMSGNPSRFFLSNSLSILPGCSFTRMGQKHFWKTGTNNIALHLIPLIADVPPRCVLMLLKYNFVPYVTLKFVSIWDAVCFISLQSSPVVYWLLNRSSNALLTESIL